jgi:hypothetical protein
MREGPRPYTRRTELRYGELTEKRKKMKTTMKGCSTLFAFIAVLILVAGPAVAAGKKPNVVMLMSDDVG